MDSGPLTSVLGLLRRFTGTAPEKDADAPLLDQFARCRDEQAFAALLRRHGPMVLETCRRVLPDAEDAEDAFQATFLVLARKAGSVRKGEALGAWLHNVAVRVALKMRSQQARRRAEHDAENQVPFVRSAA